MRAKKWIFCTSLAFFVSAAPALAAEDYSSSKAELDAEFGEIPRHRNDLALELLLDFHQYDYKELVELPKKSTETGLIPMVHAGVSQDYRTWFASAFVEFGGGNTLYDGSTQKGDPVQSNTKNFFSRLEGDLGLPLLKFNRYSRLSAYGGLGYRYWQRGDGSSGLGDYKEIYDWLYLPIGVRFQSDLGGGFSYGLDVSARLSFGGRVQAFLSHDDFEPDLTLHVTPVLGYRAQAPLSFRMSNDLSIVVAPWLEYSALGESESGELVFSDGVATFHEPDSRTWQYGISAGITTHL